MAKVFVGRPKSCLASSYSLNLKPKYLSNVLSGISRRNPVVRGGIPWRFTMGVTEIVEVHSGVSLEARVFPGIILKGHSLLLAGHNHLWLSFERLRFFWQSPKSRHRSMCACCFLIVICKNAVLRDSCVKFIRSVIMVG